MSISQKEKACGGLHVKQKTDDVVYIEHNGEKLKIHFHGITEDGEAAFSFVGSKQFLVAREKMLRKMGIVR